MTPIKNKLKSYFPLIIILCGMTLPQGIAAANAVNGEKIVGFNINNKENTLRKYAFKSVIFPCHTNGDMTFEATVAVPFGNYFTTKNHDLALICKGDLNVSVGQNCQFELKTADCVSGTQTELPSELKIQLLNGIVVLEEGIGSMTVDGMSPNGIKYEFIGKTFTYKIISQQNGNFCQGNIRVEDKAPPVVQCPADIILGCAQVSQNTSPLPKDSGEPTWIDCSYAAYSYSEQIFTSDCSKPFTALPVGVPGGHSLPTTGNIIRIIVRTFVVVDKYGNATSCEQVIFIKKDALEQVVCPADKEYGCKDAPAALTPSVTGSPMLDVDGHFNTVNDRFSIENMVCSMSMSYTDDTLKLCSNSFKILRTWTIIDWCATDNPLTPHDERRKTCTQIISVIDKTPPSVTAQFSQYYVVNNELSPKDTTVNFDGYAYQNGSSFDGIKADVYPLGLPNMCGGKVRFTLRADDWSCTMKAVTFISNDSRVKILSGYPQFNSQNQTTTAIFEGNFTEYGDYEVIITAKDECGYAVAKKTFVVHIKDNIKPFAVCIETTTVSLGTTGTARVLAPTFNSGSADNCGIDRYEVRRMENCADPADINFKNYVDFSCCDIGKTIQVIFRVWDQAGNYNDCMVNVLVDDKLKPTCFAPPTMTISCEKLNLGDFSNFGEPTLWDNCGVKDKVYSQNINLDNCRVGSITRKWVIADAGGKKDSCAQIINVTGKSDFIVDFPDDITAKCFAEVLSPAQQREQMLKNDPTKDGHIINNGCGIIAVEVKDDTLTTVPDACYKILRQIKVIDWCKYNPNNDFTNSNTSCFGEPICGDVHSNSAWETQNAPAWQTLVRPACTNPRERRFRDADGLVPPTTSSLYSQNATAYNDGIICFTQIIKIVDTDAPVFTNNINGTSIVIKDADGVNCTGLAKVTVNAQDYCTGIRIGEEGLRYTWRVVDRTKTDSIIFVGTGNKLITNGLEGVLLPYDREVSVSWTVIDRCGNTAFMAHKLKVVDAKSPAMLCRDINVALATVNGTGMATASMTDLCSAPSDNCTSLFDLNKKITLVRESASTGSYPSVVNTSAMFTCDDKGKIIPIQVWVIDGAGNTNYCTAKVTVQDNNNVCNPPLSTIDGTIKTETGSNVANVTVAVTQNGAAISSIKTTTTGNYIFGNLISGKNYTIKPTRDDNITNGVTTFDIALLSKHILGISAITSPYKMIAADVDRNGELSTADMLFLRKLILRQINKIPNGNTSWRFVDKNYNFINPQEPFYEDFPEVTTINNSPLAAQANFIALKVGDINQSANTLSFTNETTTTRNAKIWTLTTEDIALESGKEYEIALTSEQFEALGFQFTLNVTEGVEILKIENADLPAMSEANFGKFKNAITTSWNGDFSVKSADIFKIVLKTNKNTRLSKVLSIGSNLTTAEAFNRNGEAMYIDLRFRNKTEEGDDFKLHQNEPNPFDSDTHIGFNLPEAAKAQLTIYDASGRILLTKSSDFEKGYNAFLVNKMELPVSGVLFYRLNTPTHSATKKLIVL